MRCFSRVTLFAGFAVACACTPAAAQFWRYDTDLTLSGTDFLKPEFRLRMQFDSSWHPRALYLDKGKKSDRKITSYSEMRSAVRITNAKAALAYCRLRTSLPTHGFFRGSGASFINRARWAYIYEMRPMEDITAAELWGDQRTLLTMPVKDGIEGYAYASTLKKRGYTPPFARKQGRDFLVTRCLVQLAGDNSVIEVSLTERVTPEGFISVTSIVPLQTKGAAPWRLWDFID